MSAARELVQRQADDEALWFISETAPEAMLQQALRELHRAVEQETGGETGPLAVPDPKDSEIAALRSAVAVAARTFEFLRLGGSVDDPAFIAAKVVIDFEMKL